MHLLLEMTAARSPPTSTSPFAAGQVDGVLLAGDEGEVGRKQVLHHRCAPHPHAAAASLLLLFAPEEGAFVVQGLHVVRLVVEGVVAAVVIRADDLAILMAPPWRDQQGGFDVQHPELGAYGGGLAGLEVVDDASKGHGQGGKRGCALGVGA
jgi:hypothetical protein